VRTLARQVKRLLSATEPGSEFQMKNLLRPLLLGVLASSALLFTGCERYMRMGTSGGQAIVEDKWTGKLYYIHPDQFGRAQLDPVN